MKDITPPFPKNEIAVSAYVRLIRTAELLHARVSQGLHDEGLTASQFSSMKALRLRGPMSQKDIAHQLLKTGGNITLVVDNLVLRKLVVRGTHPTDRRVSLVELTPLGEATFDRIYPEHLRRIEHSMEQLSGSETQSLIDLLRRLESVPLEPCSVHFEPDRAMTS